MELEGTSEHLDTIVERRVKEACKERRGEGTKSKGFHVSLKYSMYK